MKRKLFWGVLFGFLIAFNGNSQENNCLDFKNGKFIYPDFPDKATVRKGAVQKSYINGKVAMIFEVEWLNDCDFVLTLKKFKKPFKSGEGGPKIGDQIFVEIISTDEKCFTCNVYIMVDGKYNQAAATTGILCRE